MGRGVDLMDELQSEIVPIPHSFAEMRFSVVEQALSLRRGYGVSNKEAEEWSATKAAALGLSAGLWIAVWLAMEAGEIEIAEYLAGYMGQKLDMENTPLN
jgi:hypothetical protein